MLSADVRLEGFTATDWIRVLALFRPRRTSGGERDPERPRGGVIAVHSKGRLQKLVHTEVGRLRLEDAQRDWPLPVDVLAHRHHASWSAILEIGTLDAIINHFGARARRGDDLVAQTLLLLSLARAELSAGRIELWPLRLRGAPIPTPGMVKSTLDSVCPVNRSMVLGLFEAGELWTSVALHRGPRGFDLILGPDEVRGDMGLLAGDWRRDYRHLSRAIEERAGPLALGCYAEAATFEKLEIDPSPGAWARAVAVRDVILSPLAPALSIPLGIDATWAALSAIRSLAERIDPIGIVGPSLEALRQIRRGDRDVASVLGFEPLVLLRKLLSRDR